MKASTQQAAERAIKRLEGRLEVERKAFTQHAEESSTEIGRLRAELEQERRRSEVLAEALERIARTDPGFSAPAQRLVYIARDALRKWEA